MSIGCSGFVAKSGKSPVILRTGSFSLLGEKMSIVKYVLRPCSGDISVISWQEISNNNLVMYYKL